MIKIGNFEIIPTIFPDKTSQIWKLSDNILAICDLNKFITVQWQFENESEVFQVCQLADLLKTKYPNKKLFLYAPYLPYGRQDKSIQNNDCFAQITFLKIISKYFDTLETLDAHSENVFDLFSEQLEIRNVQPNEYIKFTIDLCKPNFICFPDKGASKRGYLTRGVESFNLEKDRDPLTGKINGVKSVLPLNLTNQKILILDDICDGGWTFTEAAKVLYQMGAEEVYLYVTHGIFSKGTQVLKDAGIKRIFTYMGEVNEQK